MFDLSQPLFNSDNMTDIQYMLYNEYTTAMMLLSAKNFSGACVCVAIDMQPRTTSKKNPIYNLERANDTLTLSQLP